MDMLINTEAYSLRDLQNMKALLHDAVATGQAISAIIVAIDTAIGHFMPVSDQPISPKHRRSDNAVTCSICGGAVVIVPLVSADCTKFATHAIQCQNRPATDQPWRDGMCGHTEYILRGNK